MCQACNQIVYKNMLADHIRSAHCCNGEAAARPVPAQRLSPAKPPVAQAPLKPLAKSLISSKPLEPLKRKMGRVAKPQVLRKPQVAPSVPKTKPVQKPHTDAKVLVMQHVLGDHSVAEKLLADCELCTFEGKYKCSYKIIARFCERLRIPTPIDKYFAETQAELERGPQAEPQKDPQFEPQVRPPLASHAGQQLMEVAKVSPKAMKPKTPRPGPKHRGTSGPNKQGGSKSTGPVPTGPKPKAPKMTVPKTAARKSEPPAKTDENRKSKTPVEIKKEKFDHLFDDKIIPESDASKKVEREKSAVQQRIKKMEKKIEKEMDLADTANSNGDVVKSGVPLSCSQCEHFAWTKARMKQHVEAAHGTPKVGIVPLIETCIQN